MIGICGIVAVQMSRSGTEIDSSWSTNYEASVAKAAKEHKNVLIEFGATWCGPCQQLRKEVFNSPEFKDAAKDLVLVYVDIDKRKDIADRYGVNPIPDVRIQSPSGNALTHSIGYKDLTEMLTILQSVR